MSTNYSIGVPEEILFFHLTTIVSTWSLLDTTLTDCTPDLWTNGTKIELFVNKHVKWIGIKRRIVTWKTIKLALFSLVVDLLWVDVFPPVPLELGMNDIKRLTWLSALVKKLQLDFPAGQWSKTHVQIQPRMLYWPQKKLFGVTIQALH